MFRFVSGVMIEKFRTLFDVSKYPSVFRDYGKDEIRWLLRFYDYKGDVEECVDSWSHLRYDFRAMDDDKNSSGTEKILQYILKDNKNTGLALLGVMNEGSAL
jgi:hypothetical protein